VSDVSRRLLHKHPSPFLSHVERAERFISRRGKRLARAEAKVRAMPRANNLTGFHFSLSQCLAVVCATVFYCVGLRAAAYDNDGDAVDLNRQKCCFLHRFTAADVDPF
jgi:hypothetical protein